MNEVDFEKHFGTPCHSEVGKKMFSAVSQFEEIIQKNRKEVQEIVKLAQILAAIVRANLQHKEFGHVQAALKETLEKNGLDYNRFVPILFSVPSDEVPQELERTDIEKRLDAVK